MGNYTRFVAYKMNFWLALPSCLLKVPIEKRPFSVSMLRSSGSSDCSKGRYLFLIHPPYMKESEPTLISSSTRYSGILHACSDQIKRELYSHLNAYYLHERQNCYLISTRFENLDFLYLQYRIPLFRHGNLL